MFERKWAENFEKRKKEETFREEEIQEIKESQEEELRKEFAGELRKPFKKSFLKKMERVVCAFILAGLAVFAVPKEGWAPSVTKERIAMKIAEEYYGTDEHQKAMKIVLDAIQEKGGIQAMEEFPETVLKKASLSGEVRLRTVGERQPYFTKPEIVLGKKFIENHPQQAKEYFQRIHEAQKASVWILTERGAGSGAIVQTRKGWAILTNEHVVKNQKRVIVEFINGLRISAEVAGIDRHRDLAVLKIGKIENSGFFREIEKNVSALEIADNEELDEMKHGDTIAMIGHPFSYPFEVSIGKYKSSCKLSGHYSPVKQTTLDRDYEAILSNPDERFQNLINYYDDDEPRERKWGNKGYTIPGMSGGPIINLDRGNKPKLIGLNAMVLPYQSDKMTELAKMLYGTNIGVSAKEIRNFLKENGY